MDFSELRTLLFVPGDRSDRFAKAVATQADAVILDLEDAVASGNKDVARCNVAAHSLPAERILIRINASGTREFERDLDALRSVRLTGIVVPKAERREQLEEVAARMRRDVSLIPLIETARGLQNAEELLRYPGSAVAAFGTMDFANDLGCVPEWDELLHARAMLVLHSRNAGRPAPIDGVCARLDDDVHIQAESHRALRLGFGGKLAIHPRQIEPIIRGFAPSAEMLSWARSVLARAESGAQRIAGEFVDGPVVERARRIIARSGAKRRR